MNSTVRSHPAASDASALGGSPSQEPLALTRYWCVFAGVALVAIVAAAIRWSLAHPFGVHWDEAGYLNEALIDVQRLRHGMLIRLAGRILLKSWGRPPAYRLLGDPFIAIFGTATTTARLVSLACFCVSSWFVYLCAKQLQSRIAGAFAVLLFCLAPEIVGPSSFFGTEGPLFIATAALLYYLIRSLDDPAAHARDWIWAGLALALGFLSKTSFFIIGPPAFLSWLVFASRKNGTRSTLAFTRKTALITLLVAGPWWVVNFKGAVAYTAYARGFERNSLGAPSLATWLRWLNSAIQCFLGYGISAIIVLVIVAALITLLLTRKSLLSPVQRYGMWICAAAGLPIVLAQLAGTNSLLRHISPVMIPLALAVAVLNDRTLWGRRIPSVVLCSAAFCLQLAMLLDPVFFPNTAPVDVGFVNTTLPWRIFARYDQWDWKPLWQISQSCGLHTPTISFLGGGREFDPPAMQLPWVEAALPARHTVFDYPDVKWLWRYEQGPLDWQKVMNASAQSDLVVTAPGFVGETRLGDQEDNQYNQQFSERLAADPRFQPAGMFYVGRFTPVRIIVFTRRGLSCALASASPGVSQP